MRLTTVIAIASMTAPAAWGADVAVTLPIDSVTVYRDSATITRQGPVQIPAGEHRLVVRGLPDGVDPGTLRLSARSAALRLGGIELQRIVEEQLVNETERTLNRKLRDLGDQRSAIEDEVSSAQAQLKLLEGVVAAPTGSGMNAPPLQTAAIGGLVNTVGSSDATARQRIRIAKLQLRDLDEQAAKVKAELAKVATARKARTELRASVHASAATNATFSVEYQVTNVGWDWQYEARLDSQKKVRGAGAPGAIAARHGRRLEQHRTHHQHVAAQPQRHHPGAGFAVPEPGVACKYDGSGRRYLRRWW